MNKLSVIGAALLAALPATAAAAATAPTCAMAPSAAAEATLQGSGLLPELATALQEAGGCTLQEPAKTAPELAAARSMGFDCASDDTACLRKLAALLRVQRVIGVAAEQKEDSLALLLVVVDAKSGERLAEAQGPIVTSGPVRGAALRELATRLLAPPRVHGSLRLAVSEPGAQVVLDGLALGTTPLAAPIEGLLQGPHTLVVKGAGFKTLEQQVEVVAGEERVLELTLEREEETAAVDRPDQLPIGAKKPPPPLLEVVGWSVAAGGGGIALLGGLGALALDSTLLYSDAGDFAARTSMLTAERVLAGVAVVGVVAGAIGLGIALQGDGE